MRLLSNLGGCVVFGVGVGGLYLVHLVAIVVYRCGEIDSLGFDYL